MKVCKLSLRNKQNGQNVNCIDASHFVNLFFGAIHKQRCLETGDMVFKTLSPLNVVCVWPLSNIFPIDI